jgi:hypothetical protein
MLLKFPLCYNVYPAAWRYVSGTHSWIEYQSGGFWRRLIRGREVRGPAYAYIANVRAVAAEGIYGNFLYPNITPLIISTTSKHRKYDMYVSVLCLESPGFQLPFEDATTQASYPNFILPG